VAGCSQCHVTPLIDYSVIRAASFNTEDALREITAKAKDIQSNENIHTHNKF
jgi:hypothetical protein